MADDVDRERLDAALLLAGRQWGKKSGEEIIAALDAAGFMIVRKERAGIEFANDTDREAFRIAWRVMTDLWFKQCPTTSADDRS